MTEPKEGIQHLQGRTREKNSMWKGGIKYSGGYRSILKDGKYIKEHRLVWQDYHKASLLPWSTVHHVNGDKLDNRIENLEGMSMRQHTIAHNIIDTSNRRCLDCGSSRTYVNTRGCKVWNRFLNGHICVNCYNKRWRRARKK